jgi:hypothetical protein
VAVGENVTFAVQLSPSVPAADNVAGQLSVSPKFVVAATLFRVTVCVPTFEIMIGCEALVVP